MTIGPQQQAEEQAVLYDVIECDLYLRIKENSDGETASLHCKELLKDSATEVTLINPRYNESDVELQRGGYGVDISGRDAPESPRETLAIGMGGALFPWR